MSRKHTTATLTQAAVHYLSHKRYSCHIEIGVEAWGKKRLDVLALNTKGDLIGCEVKSCPADYRTDKKWKTYLPYTNRLYMVFSQKLCQNEKFMKKVRPELKEHGVGIMMLSEKTGYVQVKLNAKKRQVDPTVLQELVLRMAWRGGESRRTIKRRKRLYLNNLD
tara:strand:+ start:29697 stop:30188 length:492 start_codon:yes stop_codon:yes gene_type:complete